MRPETLLFDRTEEKAPAVSRKPVEAASEDAISLKEDTTLRRVGHSLGEAVRRPNIFPEGEAGEEAGGAVQIVFDKRTATDPRRTPLRASLEALGELRTDAAVADWLEVAVILKRDVVRLSDTNYSRHAAVLLALADALTFTESAEVPVAEDAKFLLSHALGLLSEPYISEASEEEFLGELLMAGWNLAPSKEQSLEPVD